MTELFVHYQNEVRSEKALFLYHGTGGNETDLLPLVQPYLESHTIVGLRGNVQEQGMNRFFVRLPDGTFDQESIREQTEKLQSFISTWCSKNSVEEENITHIGYSNGANFILAHMFLHPEDIREAALLHSMLPFKPSVDFHLPQQKLFVSWSANDQLISPAQSKQLLEILKITGAKLKIFESAAGHALTREEVSALQNFIQEDDSHVT